MVSVGNIELLKVLLISVGVAFLCCIALVVTDSALKRIYQPIITAAQIMTGIWVLAMIATGVYLILISWVPVGNWQIWIALALAFSIGLLNFTFIRKSDDTENTSLNIFQYWLVSLFIPLIFFLIVALIVMLFKHPKF